MSTLQNFPSTKPSLSLNFARSQSLDPRISFTRTSSATRISSDGLIKTVSATEPRFDFDPTTGECLGLLIEESRTNILTYSEQIDNAAWTKSNCSITPNVAGVLSPDGLATSDKIVENTASSSVHFALQGSSSSSGSVYTFSVFLKAAERTSAQVGLLNQNSPFDNIIAYVNLSTGQVSSTSFGTVSNLSVSTVAYPNGWYRVVITGLVGSSTALQGIVWTANSNDATSAARTYTGDGVSGLYIWGAQLELGYFPSSYVPTSASQVTRTNEYGYASIAANSTFYSQSEGSILTEVKMLTVGTPGGRVIWSLNQSGGFGEGLYMSHESGSTTFGYNAFQGGANQAALGTANISTGIFYKTIYSYKVNNIALAYSGILAAGDTSANLPTIGRLVIGNNAWGGDIGGSNVLNSGNCHIKSFVYYPVRLPDSQLQALTK